jgi:hypothetical protein
VPDRLTPVDVLDSLHGFVREHSGASHPLASLYEGPIRDLEWRHLDFGAQYLVIGDEEIPVHTVRPGKRDA